jgi:hypothetical protein
MGTESFKKKLGGGINFMTLQDLITAVIGILIVFCLLLVLSSTQDDSGSAEEAKFDGSLTNLVSQINNISNALENIKNPSSLLSGQTASNEFKRIEGILVTVGIIPTQAEANSLTNQNKKLEREIADLVHRYNANQIILSQLNAPKDKKDSSLFLQGPEKKEQVLVMDIGKKITWFRLSKQDEKNEFLASDTPKQQSLLASLDRDRDRVVLFVRPSGIEPFREIYDLLKQKKISLGTDSLQEGQKLDLKGK